MKQNDFHQMPVDEVDKQIDMLLGDADGHPLARGDEGKVEDEDESEDWEPPVLEYAFPECVRIVEAFYGLDAEILDGDAPFPRRIQVTKDMVALCKLPEPNRRGMNLNWSIDNDTDTVNSETGDETHRAKTQYLRVEKNVRLTFVSSVPIIANSPVLDSLKTLSYPGSSNTLAVYTSLACTAPEKPARAKENFSMHWSS